MRRRLWHHLIFIYRLFTGSSSVDGITSLWTWSWNLLVTFTFLITILLEFLGLNLILAHAATSSSSFWIHLASLTSFGLVNLPDLASPNKVLVNLYRSFINWAQLASFSFLNIYDLSTILMLHRLQVDILWSLSIFSLTYVEKKKGIYTIFIQKCLFSNLRWLRSDFYLVISSNSARDDGKGHGLWWQVRPIGLCSHCGQNILFSCFMDKLHILFKYCEHCLQKKKIKN